MKPTKEYNGRSTIRMYLGDCMDLMKTGTWDLAIVDPPYGINASKKPIEAGKWKRKIHKQKDWDSKVPDAIYFDRLNAISKNMIIWGANHYIDNIPFNVSTPCWIVWDKKTERGWLADCELAWTSFNTQVKKFTRHHIEDYNAGIKSIHPTQKPVQLYKWLLTNYAKQGDTILDTHGGSMSIAIACWDLGFDLDIIELDEDYFNDAVKRFEQHISQTQLF